MSEPVRLVPYDPAWPQRFVREASRIRAALGEVVAGGVLDGLEHIGSSGIPGMAAKPCLDLLARVHPFPLPRQKRRALEALGYGYRGENGIPGREYFTRGPHEVHLHVVGFGTEHWQRHLLFRDYLRANAVAAARYEALKLELASRHPNDRAAYGEGKSELVGVLEREALAWHLETTGFAPVETAAREFSGLPAPWMIASGWALELFLDPPSGVPSRYHDDLDVVVFRDDLVALQRHLSARGWRLDQVIEGRYAPWRVGEALASAAHQVHARRGDAFLDLLVSPRRGEDWLYRRDERLALPLAQAILRARGVPHLAPELVLLFKSRSSRQGGEQGTPRGKDQQDFERVLPHLAASRRAWLAAALERTAPGHPWLERLRGER